MYFNIFICKSWGQKSGHFAEREFLEMPNNLSTYCAQSGKASNILISFW